MRFRDACGAVFTALKLRDADGRISLTNLSVYVVLFAFSFSVIKTGAVNLTGLGALLTALGAYREKAYRADKREAREHEKAKARINELERTLNQVSTVARSAAQVPPGLKR